MPRHPIARLAVVAAAAAWLGSGTAAESRAEVVWQWILIGVLVLGALGVLTAARKRGPEAAEAVESTEALLAQYRRIATRSEQTAPTDEEIAYQRAALGALKPHLDRTIAAARTGDEREALRAIKASASDLRRVLRAAKGTALKSPERAAVAEAAGALGRAVDAGRGSGAEEP
jgi:hypothetical protein